MQNVEITIQGDTLVLKCSLKAPTTTSASGKTQVLATTRGNAKVDTPDGPVFVGLNVYRK